MLTFALLSVASGLMVVVPAVVALALIGMAIDYVME